MSVIFLYAAKIIWLFITDRITSLLHHQIHVWESHESDKESHSVSELLHSDSQTVSPADPSFSTSCLGMLPLFYSSHKIHGMFSLNDPPDLYLHILRSSGGASRGQRRRVWTGAEAWFTWVPVWCVSAVTGQNIFTAVTWSFIILPWA